MRFPDSARVRYTKNPLVEVICQLRFPKILRIETEAPVSFQESIRSDYPLFNTLQPIDLSLLVNASSKEALKLAGPGVRYEFTDKKKIWKVTLSGDFLALSTSSYEKWEDFEERLSKLVNILQEHYQPSYFTRIGLRYKDVVIRSELNLEDCPWKELFKAQILGIFLAEELPEESIPDALSVFSCQLDYEDALVRVQHGIAQKEGTRDLGYLIDSDFYTEKYTEVDDAIRTLELFNREAGRLFRWCITKKLSDALDPQPV